MNDTPHSGLPVAGYRPQSTRAVTIVNYNKQIEEWSLRQLDELKANPEVDQRWLAIGRTAMEQAWMAINRSVFKPERIAMSGDAIPPEPAVTS